MAKQPAAAITETDEEKEKKSSIEWTIKLFEEYIEERFNDYTIWKLFNHKKHPMNYEVYDSVWEYLKDSAEVYCKTNPQVVMTVIDDDSE